MIDTNYKIEALDILLNRECLGERYFPLTERKNELIRVLSALGCRTKGDAEKFSCEELARAGLESPEDIRLFKKFLTIYDTSPQKLREIDKVTQDLDERKSFYELYHLPGVKAVRARLYYRSGFKSVADFAETSVDTVLARTAATIDKEGLDCIVPLPKEVRTQIAVAKAFTYK